MKLSRQDGIKILCAIAIGSAALAFVQGWMGIQMQYFLILVMVIVGAFAFWHKKEGKTMDVSEAYKAALPYLREFNFASESGAKLNWASRHSDDKRFSSTGKVWDLEFQGSPSKAVVQIDAKTGKVVNLALNTESRQPPFFEEPEERIGRYTYPRRVKKEYKEEVKPE